MFDLKKNDNCGGNFRLRAEEIALRPASNSPEKIKSPFSGTSRSLLHELQVRQIELELQNTELHQAQNELAATRKRYFSFYDLAPVGYFSLNKEGLILEANLASAALLAVDRKALCGQALTLFITADDQDAYYQHRKLLFETTGPQTCELRMQKKDGTIFRARLDETFVANPDGLDAYLTVVIDITERKMAESLVDSESRYRALIEQAPEAVLICDPNTGAVLEANSRFTERFGYDLSRDRLLNLFSLIIDEQRNVRELMQKAKQTGVLAPQRQKFLHKNGTVLHVEGSAAFIHYKSSTLFMMTLRDISAEVRLEQEIYRDAQLAVRVQKSLLTPPQPSEHLEIALVYHPYTYVGGDLYFMDWRYRGEVLRGFLIDTAGHGLGIALHTSAMHVLLREINDLDLPLSEQMRWLNRRAHEYFDEGTFAGALGFELDLQTRQLRWVCAGMPELWVSTRALRGVFKNPGMYLGMSEDECFETHTVSLEADDILYVMTDGLTDLLGRKSEWPLDRYREMVTILQTMADSSECRDDATAICIRILSFPAALIPQHGWPRTLRFSSFGDYKRLKEEVSHILAEATGRPHSVQEIAVNEALANAMECRDGVPRQQQAILRFSKIGNRLIFRVKSSRTSFAGNAFLRRLRTHPEEMFSFDEDASMGRGIPIMLSLSHQMTYNSEGTELLLAWKLPTPGTFHETVG